MRVMIGLIVVGLAALSALFPAMAKNALLRAYTLPRSNVVSFKSEINGVDYELYVRLPLSYGEGDKSYPLLVTLDADYQFAIAANHVEHLSGRGQAPEMVIVSIGYLTTPMTRPPIA